MDRISDSGSDGLGSNPDGSTKNAFVGIYRPYSGKNTGKGLKKTLPVFYFMVSQECGGGCPKSQTFLGENRESASSLV